MSGRLLVPMTRLYCHDGIAGHLATLLPLLQSSGWLTTMVVGTYDCPESARPVLERLRAACERFEIDPRLIGGRGMQVMPRWHQLRSLRRWVQSSRPDVIHIHGRALGPVARLAARGVGRVYTRHLALSAVTRAAPASKVPKWPRLWCDRAIGISLKTCAELRIIERMPAAMVRYVPHGVDLSRFRPPTAAERRACRAVLGIDDNTFVCLQLGRVVPVKRPETLANAVARLRSEGRKAIAILAGHTDPETVAKLRVALPDGGAEWLRLLGHADPRQALWAADVKVLASEREGFATAIVEAMACGIVPLRTPTDGADDQIDDGVDGLLFDIGDHVALSESLAALMDDPTRRVRMGVAARAKAEQFAATTMAERTESIYRELIDRVPDPRCLRPV